MGMNLLTIAAPVRVTVAAAPPTAHLFETMTNLNLQPVHVYGLTETYGPITKGYILPEWQHLPDSDRYARMARQGHGFLTSLPCRVIKTRSDDAGDRDLPQDTLEDVSKDGLEIGEIVCSGNICAKGYYRDPAATRRLFAGGVLHTGDLAVWHADGAVQIRDRAKDVIISGGENISSLAVEALLVTHPAVMEAACVAVPHEKWGETPKAYVTLRRDRASLKGDELIQWAKGHSGISRFMVPSAVEVVPELPKTSTGKLRKNLLRDWARGNG